MDAKSFPLSSVPNFVGFSVLQTNRHARCVLFDVATCQAVRLRCPRVNGFFLGDDQSGRFFVFRRGWA